MFYVITATALAGVLVFEGTRWRAGVWLAKPVASTGFIAVALQCGALQSTYGVLVLVALGLSWFGDIFLISRQEKLFRAGLVSFLLGHLGYVAAFASLGINVIWLGISAPLLALLAWVVFTRLRPHLEHRSVCRTEPGASPEQSPVRSEGENRSPQASPRLQWSVGQARTAYRAICDRRATPPGALRGVPGDAERKLIGASGRMKVPVLAYIVIITLMVAMALGTTPAPGGVLRLAGALAFYVSDLAVARDRFVSAGFINRLIGLPLYYGGQLLLATSVVTAVVIP